MNAMLMQLAGLQLVLPLIVLGVNAAVPCRSVAGLVLRLVALALMLVWLRLAGVWLFPPWWTPHVLGVLLALWAVVAWRRLGDPAGRRWPEVAVAAVLIVVVGWLALPALRGRIVPDGAVDLAMPLGPGRYLVASGGASAATNAHFMTLAGDRFAGYRGQSHAVDIVGLTPLGLPARGGAMPADPTAYAIYGVEVLAPCTGLVAATVDGLPDMAVPQMDRDHMAGNHVILACGAADAAGPVVVLAHLAPGSVVVAPGDNVVAGAPLGRVGNTGNTGQPHLHLHLQYGLPEGAPLGGEPGWFTVAGRFLVRGDRFAVR